MRRFTRAAFVASALLVVWSTWALRPAQARPPFHPLAPKQPAPAEEPAVSPTPEQLREATVPGSYDRPVPMPRSPSDLHGLGMIAGETWTLAAFGDEQLEAGVRAPTITFDKGKVNGFSGCNRYSGEAEEAAAGGLALGPIAGTRMACPTRAMELEARYLEALRAVTRYWVGDDRLVLSTGDGDRAKSLFFVQSAGPRD